MRDEGRLNQRRFDQLFKDSAGDFKIFVAGGDVAAQPQLVHRYKTALIGRKSKPIGLCSLGCCIHRFADQVLVTGLFPCREIDLCITQ